MHRIAAPGPVGCEIPPHGAPALVQIERVQLLGVSVTVRAMLSLTEHERRNSAGLGPVMDPALLDRLLDLPVAIPVADPVIWAETADQPAGMIRREADGFMVTRLLAAPLTLNDVIVTARAGQELQQVRAASLFAGFARRWVVPARYNLPGSVVLDAKLCGVGILDPGGQVVLESEDPRSPTRDGWAWLLEEKVYRQWLREQAQRYATANQPPATGGATVTRTA